MVRMVRMRRNRCLRMGTTESLNIASSPAGGVRILSHTHTHISRLRPRPRPRTRPSHYNTIQPKTTTGWLFASGSSWTLRHTGGSRQDTHGTPVPEREGRGWPTTGDLRRTTVRQRHASDKRAFRKTSNRQTCCQRRQVDRHLETYMVVEHARRSHGDRAVKQLTPSRLVNRFEVEASRIIKKIAQRNGTIAPEKINQVSWNETEYIKIRRMSTRTNC